ncbi:MAG: helix-turn-helix transcriptional regulator [Actinomycetota bacterium]
MPPSRTGRRLERLLLVVPYVVRHPGTRLDELSRLFDVSESELVRDLNLLFLTGLPPYGPGDLIDVQIEEGRVWIRMADYFGRPVRLTRSEALALYLTGQAFVAAGVTEAKALASALDKLKERLGPETLGNLRVVAQASRQLGPLEAVRAATLGVERLEIDYYSASRDEVTTRRIDPEHVFSALGNWYVVAWCHAVDAERLFRVDRIRDVRSTGETFEPRGLLGQGRALYARSDKDVIIRLRLAPGAQWIADYYAVEAKKRRGADLEVSLPTKDLVWAAKLLLRFHGEATVIKPARLKKLVRRLADQTLALYRESPKT